MPYALVRDYFLDFYCLVLRGTTSTLIDMLPKRFDQVWWVLLSDCIVKSAHYLLSVLDEDQSRQLMFACLLVLKLRN